MQPLRFILCRRPVHEVEHHAGPGRDENSCDHPSGETQGTHHDFVQARESDGGRHSQSQGHHVNAQINRFAGFPHNGLETKV